MKCEPLLLLLKRAVAISCGRASSTGRDVSVNIFAFTQTQTSAQWTKNRGQLQYKKRNTFSIHLLDVIILEMNHNVKNYTCWIVIFFIPFKTGHIHPCAFLIIDGFACLDWVFCCVSFFSRSFAQVTQTARHLQEESYEGLNCHETCIEPH